MLKKKYVLFFKSIFFVFCFFLFLKIFVLDIKIVEGNSMLPTLKSGEVVFIFKLGYGIKMPFKNFYLLRWSVPEPKDLVIFKKDNRFVVKRVVGNSRTPIEFFHNLDYNQECYETVYSDEYFMKLEEMTIYLDAVQFRNLGGFADKQKIPENTILVLGDNLKESYDSRDYGFILVDGIYGKVLKWE